MDAESSFEHLSRCSIYRYIQSISINYSFTMICIGEMVETRSPEGPKAESNVCQAKGAFACTHNIFAMQVKFEHRRPLR